MILASRVLIGLSAAVSVGWWGILAGMVPAILAEAGDQRTTVLAAIAGLVLVQILGIACLVAASIRAAVAPPASPPQLVLGITSALHLLGSLLYCFTPVTGVPLQLLAVLGTSLVFLRSGGRPPA